MATSRSATNVAIRQFVETVHMRYLTWAGAATTARRCCRMWIRASDRFWHSWITHAKPATQCSESANTILKMSWNDFGSNDVRLRRGIDQAKRVHARVIPARLQWFHVLKNLEINDAIGWLNAAFFASEADSAVAFSAVDDVRCEAIVRDVDSTVAFGAVDDARLGLLDCGGD